MLLPPQVPQPMLSVKFKPAVETAAIRKRVRLIDQHAHHVGFLRKLARAGHILCMQADGMAAALVVENFPGALSGGIEILRAIDRQHQRQFSPEKGNPRPTPVSSTMKNFLLSAAGGKPHPRASTSASRAISVRLSLPSGHSAACIFVFSAAEAI